MRRLRSGDPGTILPALGAALVALGLASVTLLPGVAFWDTAEFQTVPPLLGTAHPTGFPTYVILGWVASVALQPLGEPALRMNVLSAICLAVAAGATALLVRRLTGRSWLALAAGILLATTPIAWSIGTHADAHALHLALVAVLLVLLVDWERLQRTAAPGAERRLVAAAAVYGLALGNHSLVLFLAPGIALFVLAVEPRILWRPRLVGACLLALGVTLVAVYAELPLRAGPFRAPLVYGRPETWDGFLYIALAEQFRGSLTAPFADLGQKAADLAGIAGTQLGPLAWLVPAGFAATAWRRPRYALLTAPALVITCWFAASYANAQIERYYLGPALIALTWVGVLVGLVTDGLESLAEHLAEARSADGVEAAAGAEGSRLEPGPALGPSPVFGFVLAGFLLLPTLAVLPGRWRMVDLSHERQAVEWLDAVLDERIIARDAVVVSWWSYSTPLWYAQHIEGRRPDITVVDDRTRLDRDLGDITDVIDANLGTRPVIAIQGDPAVLATLAARYRLVPLDAPGDQPVLRIEALPPVGVR